MLVQLSPWQKSSTSITISGAGGNSTNKRRAIKKGKNGASEDDNTGVRDGSSAAGVVASFVTTSARRSSKKKKMAATSLSNFTSAKEDLVATLAITSAHRVCVLGRQTSPVVDTSAGAEDDETGGDNQASMFQESKQWQYTSRPGKSTSFFEQQGTSSSHPTTNGKKLTQQNSTRIIPQIPAIMDARNNRVYALQNGNQILSSWHATDASGPDDEFSQQNRQDIGGKNRKKSKHESSLVAKLSLEKAVVSLTLVPYQKGMVCGTYADGAIFIAQWKYYKKERKEKLVLFNIETDNDDGKSKKKNRKNHQHDDDGVHVMSTVVVNKNSKQQAPTMSSKRKLASGDTPDDFTITVNQIFSHGSHQIKLCQHEIGTETDEWEIIHKRTTMLDLVAPTTPCNEPPSIVTTCQMDESTLAIVYRWKQSDDEAEYSYECTYISTERGHLGRTSPFPLPPTTTCVCPLTSSILAVGTSSSNNTNEILFYDIKHGAVVHSVSLSEIIMSKGNNMLEEQQQRIQWTMTTDPKRGRLAILWVGNNNSSTGGGGIQVAMANASLDGTVHRLPTRRNGYNLATRLRSFLATTQAKEVVDEAILVPSNPKNVMDLFTNRVGEHSIKQLEEGRLETAVDRALDRLQACHDQILDRKDENILLENDFFLKEYEASIISMLSATNKFHQGKAKVNGIAAADNPQEASPSNGDSSSDDDNDHSKVSNGQRTEQAKDSSSSSLPENGMKAVRAYTPPFIPQRFIDGAMPIVLSTLLLPNVKRGGDNDNDDETQKILSERVHLARLDAGLIVSRLLRSGKVSARLHFEPDDYDGNYFLKILRAIKLSKKKSANSSSTRTFSSVDMMHNVLSYCSDVSEHLMVTMMSYGLGRASADDMAENFMDFSNSAASKQLCQRYFNAKKDNNDDGKQDKGKISEVEALTYKLVKAGVAELLKRIVTLARCNETLLRNAMRDGLSKDEAVLIVHLLADLLSTVSKEDIDMINSSKNSSPRTKSIVPWISALCDAHKDNLKGITEKESDDEDGGSDDGTDSPIEYVRQAVNESLVQTEAVMVLRDAYEHANALIGGIERNTDPKKQHREGTSSKKESGPVPQYSVERLVF